jgi:hypothetical protein
VRIVTAASSNHAGPLRYLLESLRRLDARVDCYDLGLTARERAALPSWRGLSLRLFDYDAHPPHMDVAVNAGEYAWKPVIVGEIVEEERAAAAPVNVLWCDAGTFFHALEPIDALIGAGAGVWLRRSRGTLQQWTHPGTLASLGVEPAEYGQRPNVDATLIGFATGHRSAAIRERVYREVVVPWKACAIVRDCIAPAGSSRRNHRQDQAALSCIVHRHGFALAAEPGGQLGVRCKCDRWFYEYIGFHVPARVYARCCLY